jgi:hypothetical protein
MLAKLAILLFLVTVAGCKIGWPGPQMASKSPEAVEPLVQPASANEPRDGFSLRNMLELVSFMRPAGDETVPPQIVQLTAVLNTIVGQAADLKANDPPQLTIQKAQKILSLLSSWDTLLATTMSMELVDAQMAQPVQAVVEQLRARTHELIQFGGRPELIAAVQHSAGQLKATGNALASALASGG